MSFVLDKRVIAKAPEVHDARYVIAVDGRPVMRQRPRGHLKYKARIVAVGDLGEVRVVFPEAKIVEVSRG